MIITTSILIILFKKNIFSGEKRIYIYILFFLLIRIFCIKKSENFNINIYIKNTSRFYILIKKLIFYFFFRISNNNIIILIIIKILYFQL